MTVCIVIISLSAVWRLLIIDAGHESQIYSIRNLQKVIRKERGIATGDYKDLPGGMEFIPASHDYASDLDLFGRASIYQYINRTTSAQGNKTLAGWLLSPSSTDVILLRQEAARELAGQIEWCQQLETFGIGKKITFQTEKKLCDWLQVGSGIKRTKFWNLVYVVYPLLTAGLTFLYIFNKIPGYLFFSSLISFFSIATYVSRIMFPGFKQLRDIETEIAVLSRSLAWIEKIECHSQYLKQLKEQVTGGDAPAHLAIRKLGTVLGRIDLRCNPLYFIPVNTFFLLDLRIPGRKLHFTIIRY